MLLTTLDDTAKTLPGVRVYPGNHHSPSSIHMSNRFARLSEMLTEKPIESAIVIGDSVIFGV